MSDCLNFPWDLTHVTFPDKPTLTHRTTTGDTFYEGQPLTVSCEVPEIPAVTAFYLLSMKIGGIGSIQCQLNGGQWISGPVGDLSSIEYSPVTNDNCNLPMNANTLTVNFNITEGLKDKEIICEFPVSGTISDSMVNIQQLKRKSFYLLYLNRMMR